MDFLKYQPTPPLPFRNIKRCKIEYFQHRSKYYNFKVEILSYNNAQENLFILFILFIFVVDILHKNIKSS